MRVSFGLIVLGLLSACDGSTKSCDAELYLDADGDGWGDPASPSTGCEAAGYVSVGDDCDDADASVYPGAAEVCDDAAVNDCSGDAETAAATCRIDAGSALDEVATAVITGSSADDGAGADMVWADFDKDGVSDLAIGAPGANAVYVLSAADASSVSLDAASAVLHGATMGDLTGAAMDSPGDVDGDGYDELVIGAPGWGSGYGRAFLIPGPFSGSVILEDSARSTTGWSNDSGLGTTLASGDMDGDGLRDSLVAMPGYDSGRGTIYTFLGADTAAGGFASDVTRYMYGADTGFESGQGLALVDLDGDGLAEAIVGAPGGDHVGDHPVDAGVVYVVAYDDFQPPASGYTKVHLDADPSFTLWGDEEGDRAGLSVARVGDTDGDGHDEFLVGAPGVDWGGPLPGAAFLFSGADLPGASSVTNARTRLLGGDEDDLLGGDEDDLLGGDEDDLVGGSVQGPGDIDGDGFADLVVGAPGLGKGRIFVMYGPAPGDYSLLRDASSLLGGDEDDLAGGASIGGDANHDGLGDLLIGGGGAAGQPGRVYIVAGAGL